jgi:carboxypeptidase family protein
LQLALLVLSLLMFGSGPAKQSAADQTNKTGEVQGSVVEASTNQPIHRALVILRKAEDISVGAYTDAAGKFTFRDIDPGTYTVWAEHDGFVVDPKAERYSVTVAAGVSNDGGTLKLNRSGVVSGYVTNSSGEPITGANVQLQPWKVKKNQPSAVSYGTTDDRGNYRTFHRGNTSLP